MSAGGDTAGSITPTTSYLFRAPCHERCLHSRPHMAEVSMIWRRLTFGANSTKGYGGVAITCTSALWRSDRQPRRDAAYGTRGRRSGLDELRGVDLHDVFCAARRLIWGLS